VNTVAPNQVERPLLIYDGDCSFCKRWVERWRKLVDGQIHFEPYQHVAGQFAQIPLEEIEQAIHLVEPDGRVASGAHAVLRMLWLAGHKRWLYWSYSNIPLVGIASESVYRFVSRHRGGMNTLDLALLGRNTEPVTYFRTRSIFLRLLGVIYLISFLSLAVQITGLVGGHGLSPVADYLNFLRDRIGGIEK
jgi:predicted DCC family thiol-disulfide oxidoreductase YuxK